MDEMEGNRRAPVLYLVLPCYNEEQVLPLTIPVVKRTLAAMIADGTIGAASRAVFVDDGSRDRTWELIAAARAEDALVGGIRLSRNCGHQNALLAGMMTVKEVADAVVTMDADLQDDIEAIRAMVARYREGCDVVYGVRGSRRTDSAFKRETAQMYYRFLAWLGADIVYNHADFRLLSRTALAALSEFTEVNLFLRGLVPMLGYRHATVSYDRKERAAGETKYPLKKMLLFAWEGITSLSTRPLRCITLLGMLVLFVSILMMLWSVWRYYEGETIVGWTSVIVSIWFLGGIVTSAIGIVGEYIGKVYLESKHRPRYLIADVRMDRDVVKGGRAGA